MSGLMNFPMHDKYQFPNRFFILTTLQTQWLEHKIQFLCYWKGGGGEDGGEGGRKDGREAKDCYEDSKTAKIVILFFVCMQRSRVDWQRGRLGLRTRQAATYSLVSPPLLLTQ